ncbi:hypothetical protein C8R46DRAFT_1345830 [Mycena filopes]|nr:hypothetical protein C8R46DRAFT_1345830 [Mycena filopes]
MNSSYSSPDSYLSASSSSDPLEVAPRHGHPRRTVMGVRDNYLTPMRKGVFSSTCPSTVPAKIPLPEPIAAAYLDFTSDVLTNTTLFWRGTRNVAYHVSADDKLTSIQINRSDVHEPEPPLAVISRKSATVTLRGRMVVKIRSWIKPQGMFSPMDHGTERESLWSGEEQIAWYQPSPQQDGRTILRPAYIALQEAAVNMQDVVVVGCLVLRQKLRWDNNKNSNNYLASTARDPPMFLTEPI